MGTNWFEQLMGFQERSYAETRANLEVVGTMLRSRVNHRTYSIGEIETPTLGELRQRAVDLDVRLVSYGGQDSELERLAQEFV